MEIKNEQISTLLYLMACALHGETADMEAVVVDEGVFKLAKFHLVGALTFHAVEKSERFQKNQPELYTKWREVRDEAIRRTIMFSAERKKVFRRLSDNGISYMPLKGSIITELYPQIGMREMADVDVLVLDADERNFEKMTRIRELMVGMGYTTESFGKGNHDVYMKKPVFNFEIHSSLFGSAHAEVFREYYRNVKERLTEVPAASYGEKISIEKSASEHSYRYAFTKEDFYIFYLVHSYKHYSGSGTGLRTLADLFIYLKTYGEILDFEYIRRETEKLEISDYEEMLRHLTECTMKFPVDKIEEMDALYNISAELPDDERELLLTLAGAGVYGTEELAVKHRIQKIEKTQRIDTKRAKRRYIVSRLFPDADWLKSYAPRVYRSKIGIPFFYVYRIFVKVPKNIKKVMREIKILRKK